MTHPCNCSHDNGHTRRDILRFGAAAAGLCALGPFRNFVPIATGSPQSLKRFVVINLFGGNDSVNMVAPVTLSAYYDRRPGLALAVEDMISLDSGPSPSTDLALHPAMPNLGGLWNDGNVAFLTKVGYPSPNLSHFSSMDIYSFGRRDGFSSGETQAGWIAQYADQYAPTPMGAVSVGVGRPLDFVGGESNPFLVGSLASFQFRKDYASFTGDTASHRHRLAAAKDMLANWSGSARATEARDAMSQAHDLSDQIQASVESYSSTNDYSTVRISRQMKDIATLIQGGFETRVFFTGYGGFDTHGGQGGTEGRHADLLGYLDDAIGSFVADMKDMGVWDDMVIAVITEFGRRNFVNGSDGTDHGHAYTEILLGGGVNGGVYGPEMTDSDIADQNWLLHGVDFRSVYKEVLQGHMGEDPSDIFPEQFEGDVSLGLV